MVSPRNYFLYTPLLPAVAVGTMEERSIVEPVRNLVLGKVCRCAVVSASVGVCAAAYSLLRYPAAVQQQWS